LAVEVSKDPEVWKPIVERIVFQVFYRQLGIVAIPAGIDTVVKAIDLLCKEGKGSWRWLVQDRIIVWENVPIDKAMKVHCYVYGGKTRQKNTVFTRVGFWRCYVIETTLRTFGKTLAGRILARL
jgi:hypothetical protein